MQKIEIRKILSVDKNRLFQTVVRYQDYPTFVYGLKSVQVQRTGANTARVSYCVSFIKDIDFTVDLLEDERRGTVNWSLVGSNFFDIINGHWKVKDLGSKLCEVEYGVELKSKPPIPRIILFHLAKRALPFILKAFEKQARSACC